MSFATINSIPVIDFRLQMPLLGTWVLIASVQTDGQVLKGGVRFEVKTGDTTQLQLRGFVLPDASGEELGVTVATIVGGKGGLRKLTTPKAYRTASVRSVLDDLVKAGGEQLATGLDAAVVGASLDRWTTLEMSLGAALELLAEARAAHWRVLTDGTIWFGTERWPKYAGVLDVVTFDPAQKCRICATDDALPLPGQTIEGERALYVEHSLRDGAMRSTIYSGET